MAFINYSVPPRGARPVGEEEKGTGTFSAAASWIDLTQTGNAGSLSSGLESITATAGTRLLRLATEANGINGRYAQYLGTMVARETYTFRADVIASSLAYGTYTAKAAFVNEATVTPGTTYASQSASAPQGGTGGFILSYTALPADDGQPLYIWLLAEPPSAGAVNPRRHRPRPPGRTVAFHREL